MTSSESTELVPLPAPVPMRWYDGEAADEPRPWKVFNYHLCDSEIVVDEEGDLVRMPDVWIWCAWSPDESLDMTTGTSPTGFGSCIGCPYDALIESIGDAPMQLLGTHEVDLAALLDTVLLGTPAPERVRHHLARRVKEARAEKAAKLREMVNEYQPPIGNEGKQFYERWMPGLIDRPGA